VTASGAIMLASVTPRQPERHRGTRCPSRVH
jgi:hypothetical protein